MSSGFTFDGVHSDNMNVVVNSKSVPMTPPMKNRTQEISGFDGAWDFGMTYLPREIEIECTILSDSLSGIKNDIRQLAAKLNPRLGSKPLIFDDETDKQYFARLSNQIPLEQIGQMGTFTLQFTCTDPFTYAATESSGTFSNYITVDHTGTHVALPTLTVTHDGGTATMTNTHPDDTVETITFTSDSPSGVYVINCKEMTITKDGSGAYNFVKDDFLTLHNGGNYIENSGGISQVNIVYRDTWL